MKPDATQKNGLDGTPAEKKSDVAPADSSGGCFAVEWKPTVRERLARFIFRRRTVGEFPAAALSSAVDWTQGDVLTTTAWVDLSFFDLLRLLCSRRLLCEVRTACEGKPGRTASLSAISVLPPQFLKPGPSGDWSPEDERDLFDLVAGVGGEAPEHPCANCTNPDCFKGFLPGPGGAGHGWPCPDCVAAARIDFRDLPPARAGEQYRILEPGETIQDGDEWRPSENADWILCAGSAGCRVSGGLFRRPVQGGIGLFEAAENARHLAPMGAVWKPTPPNTACAACGELIVNEACRCGIRGPNGPGPHPEGAPGTDMRELAPGEKIQEALRLARQIAHWLNWHDAKVFTDRQSLEARASDAIDAALEISGRPCRFGTCPPSGCLIGTAHGCCGPEGLAGEPDAANPDADFWDKVEGRQPATGTKCVVCGIDCADAPRGFVRGAPIGETPALWQCPEHAEKGGAE